MKIINRQQYLERLKDVEGSSDIKIITGIRRSGKSKLMEAFMDYLNQNKNSVNIIYIDFNNLMFETLKEYHKLNDYILEKYTKGKNNYLLIDEVQECPEFEKVVNSLHSQHIFDIYLTGSNANLLSGDLVTLFTGRFIEIKVYPFSFSEFLQYYPNEDIDKGFEKYFLMGGMSGSYEYKQTKEQRMYLAGVYKTIIDKDIISHYKIRNEVLIKRLSNFLMNNVGNLVTAKKISDTFNSNKMKTNHITIGNYIGYLCNPFVFYQADRYDIKGKQYLETLSKYYLADQGFRFAVLGTKNLDYGHVYENIVYIELLRRGFEVSIGKMNTKEIDFVAKSNKNTIFIQVSDDISNENTLQRELDPLFRLSGGHKKILIARTKHEEYTINGIQVIDIARWLSGDTSFI